MTLRSAHGHERKRASRGDVTADGPITLEQFRRATVARMDELAARVRAREAPKPGVSFEEAERIIGERIEP